jgi:hypothetical protein
MLNDRTIVGLDVHGTATQAAALEIATGELAFRRISGPPSGVVGYLQRLPGSVLATYEAGPMGYGLARAAAERGLDVRVCAPGSILRAGRTSGSRPTAGTPSASRDCWPPESCPSCGYQASRKRVFVISRAAGRPLAGT